MGHSTSFPAIAMTSGKIKTSPSSDSSIDRRMDMKLLRFSVLEEARPEVDGPMATFLPMQPREGKWSQPDLSATTERRTHAENGKVFERMVFGNQSRIVIRHRERFGLRRFHPGFAHAGLPFFGGKLSQ
jgi:hypothetical protein